MFRKLLSFVFLLCFSVLILGGCVASQTNQKPKIVCSVFAAYDFVREILGEEAERFSIVYLPENGEDIHSYKNALTARDKRDILTCDLFLYVGGSSDAWLKDMLNDPDSSPARHTLTFFDTAVEKREEQETEGMKEESEHGHGHEEEYDEHLWLSLKNAMAFCRALVPELERLDASHADIFRKNAEQYLRQLEALDTRYAEVAETAGKKAVIFADRFPFQYLLGAYRIPYFAAFPGCSTETSTSYENLRTLADKINEYDVTSLLVLEHSAVRISDTLCSLCGRSNLTLRTMNSLQSVTRKEIENGLTYRSVMERNLTELKGALESSCP